jgi:hypothetical protein
MRVDVTDAASGLTLNSVTFTVVIVVIDP